MRKIDHCHFWFGIGVFFYLGLATVGLSAMSPKAEAQIFLAKSNSRLTDDKGYLEADTERLVVLDSTQGRIATLDDLRGIPETETIRARSVSFRTEGILQHSQTDGMAFDFDEKTLELEFQYKTAGGVPHRLVVAKSSRFQRTVVFVNGSREEVVVYELEFFHGVKIKSQPLLKGVSFNKGEEPQETDSNEAGVLFSLSIDQLSEQIALARLNLEERERKTRELHRVLDEILEKEVNTLSEGEKKRLDRQFPALASVSELFVRGLKAEIEKEEWASKGENESTGGSGGSVLNTQEELLEARLREVFYELAAVAPVYAAIESPRYESEGNRIREDGLSAPVLSVTGRLIDLIDLYYLLLLEAKKKESSVGEFEVSAKTPEVLENAFRVLLEIYVTVGKANDLHLIKSSHLIQSAGVALGSIVLGGLGSHFGPETAELPIKLAATAGWLLGFADFTGVYVSIERDGSYFVRPGSPKPYFWSNPWLRNWASRKGARNLLENFVHNMAAFVSRDGAILELKDPSFSRDAYYGGSSVLSGLLAHFEEARQGESGRDIFGTHKLIEPALVSICRKVIAR